MTTVMPFALPGVRQASGEHTRHGTHAASIMGNEKSRPNPTKSRRSQVRETRVSKTRKGGVSWGILKCLFSMFLNFTCPYNGVSCDTERHPGDTRSELEKGPQRTETSIYTAFNANGIGSQQLPERHWIVTNVSDTPEWALAMLLISSIMNTVLPTPAPPNRPIFPPLKTITTELMSLVHRPAWLGLPRE